MLVGHWIEARSVLGTSRALEELVKIMPTMAHMRALNILDAASESISKISHLHLGP